MPFNQASTATYTLTIEFGALQGYAISLAAIVAGFACVF
jgi:hypothetical protein